MTHCQQHIMAPREKTSGMVNKTTKTLTKVKKKSGKSASKQSPAKTAQVQEFHQYQKLPGEIKLMIWQEALRPRASIHYVKIRSGGPEIGETPFLFRDISYATRQELNKSAWLDLASIMDIGRSDPCAKMLIGKLPSRTDLCKIEGLLWQRGGKNEWRHTMTVDSDNDIVCLHFHLDYNITWTFANHVLPTSLCRLRRVAIDLNELRPSGVKYFWQFKETLQCTCPHLEHKELAFCPIKLTYLIAQLRGAETIYLLMRIGRLRDLSAIGQSALRMEAEQAGKQRQTPAEMVQRAVERYKGEAKDNNLEIFQDRETEFYEVREGPAQTLADYHKIWPTLNSVENRWRATLGHRALLVQTHFKFKVLVGLDCTVVPKKKAT